MDYDFVTEQSDYSEDYWVEDIDEEELAFFNLTTALETLNNSIDKWGIKAKQAADALEIVINTYYKSKE